MFGEVQPSFISCLMKAETTAATLRESYPTELLGRIKDDQSHLCGFRFSLIMTRAL